MKMTPGYSVCISDWRLERKFVDYWANKPIQRELTMPKMPFTQFLCNNSSTSLWTPLIFQTAKWLTAITDLAFRNLHIESIPRDDCWYLAYWMCTCWFAMGNAKRCEMHAWPPADLPMFHFSQSVCQSGAVGKNGKNSKHAKINGRWHHPAFQFDAYFMSHLKSELS